jgi:hypothetical protein
LQQYSNVVPVRTVAEFERAVKKFLG